MKKHKEEELKTVEFILKDEEIEVGEIDIISIVQEPATNSAFQLFSKQQQKEFKFSEVEERKEITGLIMRPNKKILRQDNEGNFYYCIFSPETVRQASQLYLKKQNNTKLNIEHSNYEIKKNVYLFESWIVENADIDKAKALGFSDVQSGDWFGTFKIEDESLWLFLKQHYKSGGFSIEGMFTINENYFDTLRMNDEELYGIVKQIVSNENISDENKYNQIKNLLNI